MPDWKKQYDIDLEAITHSGPHEIDEEKKALNREVLGQCSDIFPIDDIHKINDADLIFRFLIAHRWKVEPAAKAMREYAEFRKENDLNNVLWEPMPEEALALKPKFQGFDRYGHPVFYDRPDPKMIAVLLQKLPRELLLKAHFAMMEQGRRWQKIHKTDRVSCVVDLSLLTMGAVTNTKAVGFLKEMAKTDQHYYPENMRTMCLCNGGWTFNGLWKIIRPLLDVRVQKKIQFTNTPDQIDAWIPCDHIPVTHLGGRCAEDTGVLLEDFTKTAPGSPPTILGHEPVPEVEVKRVSSAKKTAAPNPWSDDEPIPNQDDEDDGQLSFHSLPSSDDEDGSTVNGSHVGSPYASRSEYNAPTPTSPPPQIPVLPRNISDTLPNTPNTIDFIVRTIGVSGPRRVEAYLDDRFLSYTTGNSILCGLSDALQAELLVEAGHPIHTYIVVVDDQRMPKYILKKRKLHREIQIFQPQVGATMVKKQKMQVVVDGPRVHLLTCRMRQGSCDQRDWQITMHKDKNAVIQALKVGDSVRFQHSMSAINPSILFALSCAITELWFFS